MSSSLKPHGLQLARVLFFNISGSLLNLKSMESVMPSNHLILCHLDCSPSVSYIHGILHTRILECVVIPFSRASSWPRDQSLPHWRQIPYHVSYQGSPMWGFSSVQSLSHVRLFANTWIANSRPSWPSPTPGVHSKSRPSSWWCHTAISSSVVPFSSCPQSLPASEYFPMSQHFAWGGQSTGVSASASFLLKKSQGWSALEWTGWISLQSKGFSRVFSNTTKASILRRSAFFTVQLSHPYMATGKTIALTRWTFMAK